MNAAKPLEEQPAIRPPFVDDPSAFVLVDWSGWLHRAWATLGVEMLAPVGGWLVALLAHRPAHVALALDAAPPTRRHKAKHPTDPDWIYKGDRPPKPDVFHTICARATRLAELHAIPCLWAEGCEADDVIATATASARDLGYRVWVATSDKDLHGLCDEEKDSGIVVGTWDPFNRTYRGPAEVRAKWGVNPWEMTDLLGIAGDSSDGVPGVDGLGFDKAAKILGACGTLEAALARVPADGAELDITIRKLERDRAEAKRGGATVDTMAAELKKLRGIVPASWKALGSASQAIERDLVRLRAASGIARFSRELTALDCDCPIEVPWEEIPVGGFHVDDLRKTYTELGWTKKAEQVPTYGKRAPWAIP